MRKRSQVMPCQDSAPEQARYESSEYQLAHFNFFHFPPSVRTQDELTAVSFANNYCIRKNQARISPRRSKGPPIDCFFP